MPEEPEPVFTKQKSSLTAAERRSEIDAEIQRIRQRCDIKYHVEAGNVAIKGHRRALDDSHDEEENGQDFTRHGAIDSDDEKNTRRI